VFVEDGNFLCLYFAPKPEQDDHYVVKINYYGQIKNCFYPAKAGHGFPYSPRTDETWQSDSACSIIQNEDSISLEISISIEALSLEENLFRNFGFNIQRGITFYDGKAKHNLNNFWSDAKGDTWDTQNFGQITGPLNSDIKAFKEVDFNNLDQMTNGMTALIKSLDIYYKAVIQYQYLVPEGCEVNSDFSNFDHIPIPQYPVKADGYYRFFKAFKYLPYKELGDHLIRKLITISYQTKSHQNAPTLIWNDLIAEDNKVYGYGSGPKTSDFNKSYIPYDQSNNNFCLKNVVFPDSFGQGFYDLSEIKEVLNAQLQHQIINELGSLLRTLNNSLFFNNENAEYIWSSNLDSKDMAPAYKKVRSERYFWRIDSVSLKDPQPFSGKLKSLDWPYLGQDIILIYMCLYNFNPNSIEQKWFENLLKFCDFYMNNRLIEIKEAGPHGVHNIYKLDHRMLTLAAFAKKNKIESLYKLNDWLQKNLPFVYQKLPPIEYSENGATKNSWSTQGVLEIYRLLGMKNQFLEFWNQSFEKAMTPLGLFRKFRPLPMNFSSYPMYFNYAKNAYDDKVISEEQLSKVFKKMFLFYGNPKILRDNFKYSLDLLLSQKQRPNWGNIPYPGYIEGVLPEGIYENGSAQAFYVVYGDYSINEFFKTKVEHSKYEYEFLYRQYTAPFQYHSDRYSYGKAESYCLLNMNDCQIREKLGSADEYTFKVGAKTPDLPMNVPVFGHLDISNLLYFNDSAFQPTGFEVSNVKCNGKELPFRFYEVFQYNRRNISKIDKAKLVFGCWNTGQNQNIEFEVTLRKKSIPKQFFNSVK
jgi:hypothetical protein